MNQQTKQEMNEDYGRAGQMVPAAKQTILPAVIESVLGELDGPSMNNFDGDQMNRWRLRSAACGPDCIGFDPESNTVMAIKYFYAHRIRMVSDRGEITEPVRCVLMDGNGDNRAFVSDGVAKDLADLIRMFGLGPYDPPIRVKVRQIKTRKGFRMYTLVPE